MSLLGTLRTKKILTVIAVIEDVKRVLEFDVVYGGARGRWSACFIYLELRDFFSRALCLNNP